MSASDDWRVLENGSVVFTYANVTSKNLSVRIFPNLTSIFTKPDIVYPNNTEFGYSRYNYTQIRIYRNNYNEFCYDKSDPNYTDLSS